MYMSNMVLKGKGEDGGCRIINFYCCVVEEQGFRLANETLLVVGNYLQEQPCLAGNSIWMCCFLQERNEIFPFSWGVEKKSRVVRFK